MLQTELIRAFGDQRGLGCFRRWVAVNNHRGACRHWSSKRGDCVWAAWGRREIGRPRLRAKPRKHDLIRGLAESKLNTIADRISVALNDEKITEKEFRLILSEVDKYNTMKAEIRGHQKQSGGLSEDENNRLFQRARDETMMTARAKLLKEIQAGTSPGP